MKKTLQVLPECYCDTLLIQLLIQRIPNHQTDGIGEVIRVLEEHFKTRKAIGVVDNDKDLKKHKASFYSQFVFQKKENDVTLKKHPDRENYLMMLTPALEKFILKAANECGIPANEIPFTEKRLRQLTKSMEAGKNQELKQFLNRIIQKKSPGTETLKNWIVEILGEDP